MHTIYSEEHRHQDGNVELFEGKVVKPHEIPRRAEIVLDQVKARKLGDVVGLHDYGLDPILKVHEPGFVDFLRTCWDEWVKSGRNFDALPHVWPVPGLLPPGQARRVPDSIDGKLGYYGIDAGTPIIAGTWRAVYASAQVALTGQRLVATGERAAFALCRPPGHHAGSNFYGGYCFLNNAAIAAQAFRDAGAKKVAILDVDYHHGNGTQEIFYTDPSVLYASTHQMPLFPGTGATSETGVGNIFNSPLAAGDGGSELREAFEDRILPAVADFRPELIIVSAGFDAHERDPLGSLQMTADDFSWVTRELMNTAEKNCQGRLVAVLEGGYDLQGLAESVGAHVGELMKG